MPGGQPSASSYSRLDTSNSAEGRSCQTNPIPRLRIAVHVIASEARQSGLRIGDRGQPASVRSGPARAGCTNKAKLGQAAVSGGQDGGDGRRANAPNKPSSSPAGRPGPWERQMCETNPIWSGPIPEPGATAPNKRNSSLGVRLSAGRNVRHRLDAPFRETKPISPVPGSRWGKPHPTRGGNHAKQTQFSPAGRPGPLGEANVRNKPNSTRSRRGTGCNGAKQTQFQSGGGASGGMERATSPRCPASGNKANSHPSGGPGGTGTRRRMPATHVGCATQYSAWVPRTCSLPPTTCARQRSENVPVKP